MRDILNVQTAPLCFRRRILEDPSFTKTNIDQARRLVTLMPFALFNF